MLETIRTTHRKGAIQGARNSIARLRRTLAFAALTTAGLAEQSCSATAKGLRASKRMFHAGKPCAQQDGWDCSTSVLMLQRLAATAGAPHSQYFSSSQWGPLTFLIHGKDHLQGCSMRMLQYHDSEAGYA